MKRLWLLMIVMFGSSPWQLEAEIENLQCVNIGSMTPSQRHWNDIKVMFPKYSNNEL